MIILPASRWLKWGGKRGGQGDWQQGGIPDEEGLVGAFVEEIGNGLESLAANDQAGTAVPSHHLPVWCVR